MRPRQTPCERPTNREYAPSCSRETCEQPYARAGNDAPCYWRLTRFEDALHVLRPQQARRRDQQNCADQDLIEVAGNRSRPTDESEGHGPDQEWPQGSPLEEARAQIAVGGETRHQDIQRQSRGAHHLGRDPEQGHECDVSRGASMPHGGVERGSQSHADGEKKIQLGTASTGLGHLLESEKHILAMISPSDFFATVGYRRSRHDDQRPSRIWGSDLSLTAPESSTAAA